MRQFDYSDNGKTLGHFIYFFHKNRMIAQKWTPDSYKSFDIEQDVVYESQETTDAVLNKLKKLPPLVTSGEVDVLRKHLAEVALGKRFLLQGGDCAELFEYCSKDPIENKLKVLLQMSLILVWGARTPIVRIARMSGQYAKPRSSSTEVIDGKTHPSFRGDNVNGMALEKRTPNPKRLLDAYFHSAATMNYCRALLSSNFADLHHPENWNLQSDYWNLEHVKSAEARKKYQAIVNQLMSSLDFMRTIGADDDSNAFKVVDLFMSHEGLLLDYESQLTRKVVTRGVESFYNLGTHYLWIGDRTRQLNGAHVEYFRGIVNPIGVKVGPSMKPEELVPLLDILNPNFEAGKVTLITRYGAKKIHEFLPSHIQAVQNSKHKVVWCCDPMHGNTESTNTGVKTRNFENISIELSSAFDIHLGLGSKLGGVHCELTGEDVTETIGGSGGLKVEDLSRNYQTYCDPRLNYTQSLDLSFQIAERFSPST
jgi:3-deoxy-7-phosphoheptulonate synthase